MIKPDQAVMACQSLWNDHAAKVLEQARVIGVAPEIVVDAMLIVAMAHVARLKGGGAAARQAHAVADQFARWAEAAPTDDVTPAGEHASQARH